MKKINILWIRNSKNKIAQLISITAIVFVAVAFLTGILWTTPSIELGISDYIEKSGTYDLRITSRTPFSPEDTNFINSLKDLDDKWERKELDLWLEDKDGNFQETKLIVMDDKIHNKTIDYKDRFIDRNEDSVILVPLKKSMSYKKGDKIKLFPIKEKNQVRDFLEIDLEVTDIGLSPEFLSFRGEHSTIGKGKNEIAIYTDKKIFGEYENKYKGIFSNNLNLKFDLESDIFSKKYEKDIENIISIIEKYKKENNKNWQINSFLDNNGFQTFKIDIEKVSAIAKIFPIFFFLIAFLVVITTMSRLIEDRRKEIGTLISIGYSKRNVYFFFIRYGIISSIIGSILGCITGFLVFPKVIVRAYHLIYLIPELKNSFSIPLGLTVSLISLIVVTFTIWYVVYSVLRENPSNLLLAKAPEAGKRIFLEKIDFLWKKINFSTKVTMRNIFRYKKRLFMTLIGISGCFALVLTAYGIKDSVGKNILDIHFDKIHQYDVMVSGDIKKFIDMDEFFKDEVFMKNISTKINIEGRTETINVSVVKDITKLSKIINFKDINGKKQVNLDKNIPLISQKLYETITKDKNSKNLSINIDGEDIILKNSLAFEHYIQNQIYIDDSLYKKLSNKNEAIEYNTFIARFIDEKSKNIDDSIEKLMEKPYIYYVVNNQYIKNAFSDSMGNLNYIVLVLNISAGLLALIILYNIININIIERSKELATVRVLGFTRKEIRGYIFKEIYILVFMGIAIGIPLGIFLHKFVIYHAEVGGIMFNREIKTLSYLYSAFTILVFTVITNKIMGKKIDKVDMVEAMKSVD